MECKALQSNLSHLEADIQTIVLAWVQSDLASKMFERNAINKKFFARHFGVRVLNHLFNVISGRVKPGECPVITVMLMFFKEKNIPLCDIFIICSSLRERLVEYFMDKGSLTKEIYGEISYLIDLNFAGVIREYFELCVYPRMMPEASLQSEGAPMAAQIERPVTAAEGAKISAAEFLENAVVAQDDIDELTDLVEDVETLLFEKESLNEETFETMKAIFDKYAQVVAGFYEFQELGYSLTVLVGVLSSIRFEDIKPEDHKKILTFFESIISDLNSWRTNIFIDQSAIDINYLDNSLLSSIAMFEVFLTSQGGSGSDEEELELF